MRPIDADALAAELSRKEAAAKDNGDGQAAGMFRCMALILARAPTLETDNEGRDGTRNI